MSINDLNIAIIQSSLFWEDKQKNLDNFSMVFKGLPQGTNLVLLPEMFTTGFTMSARNLAETSDGPTLMWMLKMSSNFGFGIGGSVIIKDGDNYYNRFLFVTPEGKVFHYDKRHLFRMGNEHEVYSQGTRRVVFEYLGWRFLPIICYDLRFPVWSRNRRDYDVLINVANFPAPRREVWNTLLKARAIENQCYVAAANCYGIDGMGISYTGDSQLISPKGQLIAKAKDEKEQIITGTFSMNELLDFRRKFPVFLDADEFTIDL